MKGIGATTNGEYLNRVDIEDYLSIGTTQASIVIDTITDVCGGIRLGRNKAIKSEDFRWWMRNFGIVVDWKSFQLRHAEDARKALTSR